MSSGVPKSPLPRTWEPRLLCWVPRVTGTLGPHPWSFWGRGLSAVSRTAPCRALCLSGAWCLNARKRFPGTVTLLQGRDSGCVWDKWGDGEEAREVRGLPDGSLTNPGLQEPSRTAVPGAGVHPAFVEVSFLWRRFRETLALPLPNQPLSVDRYVSSCL